MGGWIKVHKKLLNNPIFLKAELLQLFMYCLLRANHDETKIFWNGKEEVLEPGSFITGRKVLALATGQTESAVWKRLDSLRKMGMTTQKSNNKFTVVKVLNYCTYQGKENKKEQQSNNKVTTKEQQSNTVKNIRTKEIKNKEKDKTALDRAVDDFKEFRLKIKSPMTARAIELLHSNLNKLADDDETKIAILNQSIMNGWKSVYALKDDNPKKQGKLPRAYSSIKDTVERMKQNDA